MDFIDSGIRYFNGSILKVLFEEVTPDCIPSYLHEIVKEGRKELGFTSLSTA